MRKSAFLFSALVALLFLFGMPFATLGQLPNAAASLCGALTSLLPIMGMLMVLVASVVYALGQIMGAETRARANVWATACIGGALMAFLIVTVAPPVLSSIYGSSFTCGGAPLPGQRDCNYYRSIYGQSFICAQVSYSATCTSDDGSMSFEYDPTYLTCCHSAGMFAYTCPNPDDPSGGRNCHDLNRDHNPPYVWCV